MKEWQEVKTEVRGQAVKNPDDYLKESELHTEQGEEHFNQDVPNILMDQGQNLDRIPNFIQLCFSSLHQVKDRQSLSSGRSQLITQNNLKLPFLIPKII
jgi:hypothetical protein